MPRSEEDTRAGVGVPARAHWLHCIELMISGLDTSQMHRWTARLTFTICSFFSLVAGAQTGCPSGSECVTATWSAWCFPIAPTPCQPNPSVCPEISNLAGERSFGDTEGWI